MWYPDLVSMKGSPLHTIPSTIFKQLQYVYELATGHLISNKETWHQTLSYLGLLLDNVNLIYHISTSVSVVSCERGILFSSKRLRFYPMLHCLCLKGFGFYQSFYTRASKYFAGRILAQRYLMTFNIRSRESQSWPIVVVFLWYANAKYKPATHLNVTWAVANKRKSLNIQSYNKPEMWCHQKINVNNTQWLTTHKIQRRSIVCKDSGFMWSFWNMLHF